MTPSSTLERSSIWRARASASVPCRQLRTARQGSHAQLERERARVDPGELEEIVDEQRERAHLLAQRGDVVGGLGEAVLERLQHREHVREGRAEVVARPGDELPPGVEELLQAGGHLVETIG
jgi:hypothetical protein